MSDVSRLVSYVLFVS